MTTYRKWIAFEIIGHQANEAHRWLIDKKIDHKVQAGSPVYLLVLLDDHESNIQEFEHYLDETLGARGKDDRRADRAS